LSVDPTERSGEGTTVPADPEAHRRRLIEEMTFEIVPLKSADAAIEALPPSSTVSITCSPVKGIDATIDLSERVRAAGHVAIPHLSARMVESRQHAVSIAAWLRSEAIGRLFLVGGDANPPHGPYADGLSFLRDLLDADPAVSVIGVPAYPDGHSIIPTEALDRALRAKQAVLVEAGIEAYATTQMCFDPDRLVAWLERERAGGVTLPIHLGVAGVVERSKLMTMGMRLGVGTSLRYLRKNRRAIGRLLSQSDYDPDSLIRPLIGELPRLGVDGIHCFTFNQVEATAGWRRAVLAAG